MKINGKISSYTNLIDFLNSGWKGHRTIELPTPPPPKWKSKAMNWDIIVIRKNNTEMQFKYNLNIITVKLVLLISGF